MSEEEVDLKTISKHPSRVLSSSQLRPLGSVAEFPHPCYEVEVTMYVAAVSVCDWTGTQIKAWPQSLLLQMNLQGPSGPGKKLLQVLWLGLPGLGPQLRCLDSQAEVLLTASGSV